MKTPATTYCEHCGASIEADSKFCAQCGNKLQETSASQGQTQSEPPLEADKDPTSKPLVVVAACIIAVVVGTLLFSVVYKSTSGDFPRPQMPPISEFSAPVIEKDCNTVTRTLSYKNKSEMCAIVYIKDNKYPTIVMHINYVSSLIPGLNSAEAWIYAKGYLTERIPDIGQSKHKNMCEVIALYM
jgi:uncharacterized membrane protein YvbJ